MRKRKIDDHQRQVLSPSDYTSDEDNSINFKKKRIIKTYLSLEFFFEQIEDNKLDILEQMLIQDPTLVYRSIEYFTAMHVAAQSGNTEAIEILFRFGASFEDMTLRGVTPREMAKNQDEALELIDSLAAGNHDEQVRFSALACMSRFFNDKEIFDKKIIGEVLGYTRFDKN